MVVFEALVKWAKHIFNEIVENVYRLAQIAITATRLVTSSQIEESL